MPARASDAARLNRKASASVATARRAESWVFAPEVGGRQVVRLIVSPLRIANAASSSSGKRSPPRRVDEGARRPRFLREARGALCKRETIAIRAFLAEPDGNTARLVQRYNFRIS